MEELAKYWPVLARLQMVSPETYPKLQDQLAPRTWRDIGLVFGILFILRLRRCGEKQKRRKVNVAEKPRRRIESRIWKSFDESRVVSGK